MKASLGAMNSVDAHHAAKAVTYPHGHHIEVHGRAQALVAMSGFAKTLLVEVMSATTGEHLFGFRLHPN